MSDRSPPTIPLQALPIVVVLYAAVALYFVLVVQRILLAVFVGLLFATAYFAYRLLAAVEAIADAQQRMADRQESERL